jgi:hypothetical protein
LGSARNLPEICPKSAGHEEKNRQKNAFPNFIHPLVLGADGAAPSIRLDGGPGRLRPLPYLAMCLHYMHAAMSIFLFPNVGIIHHAEARDCSRHEILDYLLQRTNCVVAGQFDKDNCYNNKQ